MIWFVLFLMVGAAAALQHPDEEAYFTCGRKLARLRYSLCYGLDISKIESPLTPEDIHAAIRVAKISKRFAYRVHRADPALGWQSQQSRNLIEKCCTRPCYIEELVSHC